jgi:hypothetical protein
MGARRQRFPDCARSPAAAFSCERPERTGCIERYFRTLKEQLLWVRHFETTGELTEALLEFRQRYNSQWLIEQLQFQSPQQAHQALVALEPAA